MAIPESLGKYLPLNCYYFNIIIGFLVSLTRFIR